EARQRPDAVGAAGEAERFVVGRLEERVRFDRLAEVVEVALRVDLRDLFALGVHEQQSAAVMLPAAVLAAQAEKQRREVAEDLRLFLVLVQQRLEQRQRILRRLPSFGDARQQAVALLDGQRLADAAGHRPGRVDLAPSQRLDDLLAELPQADATAGQF